jgi:tetratricopeptide (TPR) repeat protein
MMNAFDDMKGSRAWEKEEITRLCLHSSAPSVPPQRLVQLTESAANAGSTPIRVLSLATALYRAGQYDLGLDRLTQTDAGKPEALPIWRNALRAMIYHRMDRSDLARDALRTARAARAQRWGATVASRGASPSQSWWLDTEEDLFLRDAAILVDGHEPPDDPQLWSARAESFVTLGRPRQAIEAYSQFIKRKPNDDQAILQRALLYLQIGDWQSGLRELQSRCAADPTSASAANELAWGLVTCPVLSYRDLARARELAELAVRLAPTNANFWNTLGVVRYRLHDWTGASAAIRKSMGYVRARTMVDWLILSMCEWQLGHHDRARSLFMHALRRERKYGMSDTFSVEIRDEAAALMELRGSVLPPTAAEASDDGSAFTLVLEIDPAATWAYELRGVACIEQKKWEQAAADLGVSALWNHPWLRRLGW